METQDYRRIVLELRPTRPRAYTTIMTVMFHLAEKGLLNRRQQNRKTYVYTIALTRDEFLDKAAGRMIDGLVADFGERALGLMRRKVENAPAVAVPSNEGVAPPLPRHDYDQATIH